MSESEVVLEANLTGLLNIKRLPRPTEEPRLVGEFSLLYGESTVGALYISVGNSFELGDKFRVELKFYPISTEEFHESIGLKPIPEQGGAAPV